MKLTPWREANTHVLTHTLHYGMGVFEGVRAYDTDRGTAIFRLRDHTDRLFRFRPHRRHEGPSTRTRSIPPPAGRQHQSGQCLHPADVLLGSEGMGIHAYNLKVHVIVAAWQWALPGCGKHGARHQHPHLVIQSPSCQQTMSKAKANGNYVNSILALAAVRDGYDEALLLDPEGYVSEGSGENIFIVREGKLTPRI